MVIPMSPWGGGIATSYQITNSLLFRGSQKIYRSFTSSSTWGLSVWVRRNALGAVNPILGNAVKFNSSDTLTAGSLTTTAVYRDPTAWMHIAIAGGHLWVNGVDMGATTTSAFTCSATNCLGYDGTNYLNAEIAEFAFTDGSQPLSTTGRVDGVTGSWVPNPVSATWGANGTYLGKPWNPSSLGADYSGQGNIWTASGFLSEDTILDSPTVVYSTLNYLDKSTEAALSSGMRTISSSSTANNGATGASSSYDIPNSGLWYFEVSATALVTADLAGVGVPGCAFDTGFLPGTYANIYCYGMHDGKVYQNNTSSSFGSALATGGVLGIAIDRNNNAMYFSKDGVWQNSGNPLSGAAKTGAINIPTGSLRPIAFAWRNNGSDKITANFGQLTFSYAPPTGFNALCTSNLPVTNGSTSGSFTGNASTDGPYVYTGAVPQTLLINGNSVIWGTHADKLATGFKIRTSSSSYNSTGTNNWTATYSTPQKPTVGSNKVPSNSQGNP